MPKRVAKPIEEIEDELEEEFEEDSEDSDDEEEYEERSRLVPFVVLCVALLAFVGLGWYAYNAGTDSADSSDLALIEAEQTPIKERPVDAGGMQFPHQDKSVFETIAGEGAQTSAAQVINSSEEPIQPQADAVAPAVAATESVLQQSVVQPQAASDETVTTSEAAAPQEAAPIVQEAQEIKEVPVAEVVKEAKPAEEVKVAAPKPVATKTETTAKSAVKPKIVSAASGSQTVQLGAFKSEAEAKAAWKKVSGNAALSGKSPQVVKADLGDKGIFYRLRVSGVNADKTCASLASKSPCMVVK
jgi:hypothetical protein